MAWKCRINGVVCQEKLRGSSLKGLLPKAHSAQSSCPWSVSVLVRLRHCSTAALNNVRSRDMGNSPLTFDKFMDLEGTSVLKQLIKGGLKGDVVEKYHFIRAWDYEEK